MDIKIAVAVPINNYRFLKPRTVETSLSAASDAGDTAIYTNTNTLRYLFPHTDIRDSFYKVMVDDESFVKETAFVSDITFDDPLEHVDLSQELLRDHAINTRVSFANTGLADGWHLIGPLYSEGLERMYISDIPYAIDRNVQKLYYDGTSSLGTFSQNVRSILNVEGATAFRMGCYYRLRKESAGSATGRIFLRCLQDTDDPVYETYELFSTSSTVSSADWTEGESAVTLTVADGYRSYPFTVGLNFEGAIHYYVYVTGIYLEHAVGTSTASSGVFALDKIPEIGVSVSKTHRKGDANVSPLYNGGGIVQKQHDEPKYTVTLRFGRTETSDFRKLLEWQRGGHLLNLHMGEDWEDMIPRVLTGKIEPPTYNHDFWSLDRASFTLKFMEI